MENTEFVDVKKESDELKVKSIKEIFNGSLLTRGIILKNIGFIIWLAFLGIVYIGNNYHAEKVARTINRLQREVKELRAESITNAAELLNASRQSIVQQMVKDSQSDLKEAVEPPYKIKK